MKLQIALDTDKKKALKLCEKTKEYIDIIELGTPLIKIAGLNSIKEFKKFRKKIFADLKTMDTGFLEAELAFKAGADITSVCGNASNEAIKGAIKAAKKYKKEVLVDLISINSGFEKRVKEIIELKPNYICVHTGIDEQNKGEKPFENLKKISKLIKNSKIKIAVAGGLNQNNLNKIIPYSPEIVIVGGAITKSKNPEIKTKKLKQILK